jgi:uncharacterized protein (DUF433 family)
MELETYFEFLAPDDIRIKGTRIGIESILYEYIHRGQTPEAITTRFHTLNLEQVYATILYYLRHREHLDTYLAEWLAFGQHVREAQTLNPPSAILHLRQRKTE